MLCAQMHKFYDHEHALCVYLHKPNNTFSVIIIRHQKVEKF